MPHSIHGFLQVPSNAVLVPLANPTHKKATVKHFIQTRPIFEKFPGPGDIQQGQIGNCWQLAAINACLSQPEGPVAIMGLMADKGGGKVIVRLYVKRAWQYFQIEKSTYWGSQKNQSGALWVNILEKALLMTLSGGDYEEGGALPILAMRALLGDQGEFSNGRPDHQGTLMAVLQAVSDDSNVPAGKQAAIRGYALEMFGGNLDAVVRFARWNKGALMSGQGSFMTGKSSERTLANLQVHLQGLDADVRGMLEAWAVGMGAVEMGGRYSNAALRRYQEIARAVAKQHVVTVETNVAVNGKKSFFERFKSGTADEERIAGIFATHAYTVIGVESRRGYLGILIRNPHGNGLMSANRGYNWNKDGSIGSAKSIGGSDGWIELNDFMLTFPAGYQAGSSVASAGRQALMGQISGARPVTQPRSNAVPPPPPPPTRSRR